MTQTRTAHAPSSKELADTALSYAPTVGDAAQRVIVAEGVARAGRRSRLGAAYTEALARHGAAHLDFGRDAHEFVATLRADLIDEESANLRSERPSLLGYMTRRFGSSDGTRPGFMPAGAR